ncbi:MAG TPA: hypothetical protein VIN59_02555 [Alphaproteobacteria bacterium]
MADDKKDDKPAEAAAAPKPAGKPAKKAKPFSEAGWNAFGAVFLAGFGIAVTAMSSASFAGDKQIVTLMTLVGGVVIFCLSGMFAKMAVTEFGRELTKRTPPPAANDDSADDKDDKKAASGGRR